MIFLYGHLGSTPFDEDTTSRYWMSGLVAGGVVLVLYTVGNWILGRVASMRHWSSSPPAWWQVWLVCVVPLTVGILSITMRLNHPVLPAPIAGACVVATLLALALALSPGSLAAREPSRLGWLVLYGMGLMPALLLLRIVELRNRGVVGASLVYPGAAISTLLGTIWLGVWAWRHSVRRRPRVGALSLAVSGFCLSYLLMPLVHYLFFAPAQYRYISVSTNFFAFSPGIQVLCFAVAAIQTVGFSWLQDRIGRRASP